MKFGIIGYGKMSSAIARAAKKFLNESGAELLVLTPSEASAQRAEEDGFTVCRSKEEFYAQAELILFGVKPQKLPSLLREHLPLLEGKGVISIAAGLSTHSLREILGERNQLQRVMPNLGALVGEGMTLVSEECTLREEQKAFLHGLFGAIGKVKVLPERLMDIGSVLSGSSGAFYTLFLEALAEAGLRRGLSYGDALELTLQNHLGTILQLQGGLASEQLRKETCSPAGTTIEGVAALEREGLRAAVHAAVEASYLRCLELSGQKETGRLP